MSGPMVTRLEHVGMFAKIDQQTHDSPLSELTSHDEQRIPFTAQPKKFC